MNWSAILLIQECFNALLKSAVLFLNSKAGKDKLQQLSSGMRRTMSLDAIIGPYLQGHWPKEAQAQCSVSRKDKSTQVSSRRSKRRNKHSRLFFRRMNRVKP